MGEYGTKKDILTHKTSDFEKMSHKIPIDLDEIEDEL